MVDTRLLVSITFFVVVIGVLTAIYQSSVGIEYDQEGNAVREVILWGQSPEEIGGLFGSERVYKLEAANNEVWEKIKGADLIIIDDEEFNQLFDVSRATAQDKYGEDYERLRIDAQISFNNETIEKKIAPQSREYTAQERLYYTSGPGRLLHPVETLDRGMLLLEASETKPKGAPAWYDLPGWASFIWGIFSPILTFSLFGEGIYTGLPQWVNFTLSSIVSSLFYLIVILAVVEIVRGMG